MRASGRYQRSRSEASAITSRSTTKHGVSGRFSARKRLILSVMIGGHPWREETEPDRVAGRDPGLQPIQYVRRPALGSANANRSNADSPFSRRNRPVFQA